MITRLHLDIEQLPVHIAGKGIEDDEFAGQILRQDLRVEYLQLDDGWFVAAHGIDQVGQQVGGLGEQSLEDHIELGVEQGQSGHGRHPCR
nr:hypothetical protein [Stutzerimonas kirkiae]